MPLKTWIPRPPVPTRAAGKFPRRASPPPRGRCAANFPAFRVLRAASAARTLAVIPAAYAVSLARVIAGDGPRETTQGERVMAITLGTFYET